ncbi:MAG TPA: double-strand break repair protein AddB [Rhodobacteraceae bacterium]|nr:double-strand break repair protein AddB [Paracoccaceae bacterium]HBG97466.1 double-strand break repair protein AddB [Paracoccaceae bacterium]
MFDPDPQPRLFALPPGVDFARELVDGLRARLAGAPPEAMARVRLIVNTRRMARRLFEVFQDGPPSLLPKIALVSDPGGLPADPEAPPLARELELAGAVGQLIAAQPDLAPPAARFALGRGLAALMDEMAAEGVEPAALDSLDVGAHAAHWARTRLFLSVIARAWGGPPGRAAAERARVAALLAQWRAAPPCDPVIVAGSTGSRGATAMLMQAVAGLPQGALVLPGFDFDMPAEAWAALATDRAEDHPQHRFHALLAGLGTGPEAVRRWTDRSPPSPARNRILSLALRPAPVTDAWRAQAPDAATAAAAVAELTLVEAPDPRAEALAIALILRQAAEGGERAALITPDRVLARRVTAALDRWRLRPDDSAGMPLGQSAPGRFLRLVAQIMATRLDAETLLAALKHPLTHSGATPDRHGLFVARLELRLRRHGPAFPDAAALRPGNRQDAAEAQWRDWLVDWVAAATAGSGATAPLPQTVARHRALAEALAAGPGGSGAGALWEETAGEVARAAMDRLAEAAPAGGRVTPADYATLLDTVLAGDEVRSPVEGHPRLLIQGTLEARAGGLDLAILGGLNEGGWPSLPAADPWLNRAMRRALGLPLPERRIGLAAHDFQQAAALPRVVLSRAARDDEAETLPARWLTRLTGLLAGSGPGGQAALAAMRGRGAAWLALGAALETPAAGTGGQRAGRPAPRPPLAARPRALSVTRVGLLVRDPYAVYARHVLGLAPLDPLRPEPDPPLRGIVLHHVLARFIEETRSGLPAAAAARARLLAIADAVLTAEVPWPATRRQWRAELAAVADGFLRDEGRRRCEATPALIEGRGELPLDAGRFRLTAIADRIDRRPDGALVVYDYKTGKPPSQREVRNGDRQLPLEGAIARAGGLDGLAPGPIAGLRYVGLGTAPGEVERLEDGLIEESIAGLERLLAAYRQHDTGYTARARLGRKDRDGDYDHLARRGEWDEGDAPRPEDVG